MDNIFNVHAYNRFCAYLLWGNNKTPKSMKKKIKKEREQSHITLKNE